MRCFCAKSGCLRLENPVTLPGVPAVIAMRRSGKPPAAAVGAAAAQRHQLDADAALGAGRSFRSSRRYRRAAASCRAPYSLAYSVAGWPVRQGSVCGEVPTYAITDSAACTGTTMRWPERQVVVPALVRLGREPCARRSRASHVGARRQRRRPRRDGAAAVPSRNRVHRLHLVGDRRRRQVRSSSSLPVPMNTQRSMPLAMSISICGGIVTGCALPPGSVRFAILSAVPQLLSIRMPETSKRQKLPSRSPP